MSTTQSLPAWKEEVNAKLNEHRLRRNLPPDAQGRLAELEPSFAARSGERAASRIAARVAERYSKAPSYRDMLEQEAAKPPARLITRQPDEVSTPAASTERAAPRDAEPTLFEDQPVITTASAILAEPAMRLSRWAEFAQPAVSEIVSAAAPAQIAPEPEIFAAATAPAQTEPAAIAPSIEILPVEEELSAAMDPVAEAPILTPEPEPVYESPEEAETRMLLEELAAIPVEPARPLPARIIEFPRELVAPHKARPRQERGPDDFSEEEPSQLRIFEATPNTVASAPMAEAAVETEPAVASPAPAIPNWNAIRLDEEPVTQPAGFFDEYVATAEQTSLLLDPPIYTANMEDRLMAGIVDICFVGAGFLMFVAAFVTYTSHLPTGKGGLIAAAAVLIGLFAAYQFLFLNFAEATPGMRYAKLALCTFDDDNPSREAKRARIGALLLSALPLGLGFLWSIFDEDRLGWHDRISRTYSRSYRED